MQFCRQTSFPMHWNENLWKPEILINKMHSEKFFDFLFGFVMNWKTKIKIPETSTTAKTNFNSSLQTNYQRNSSNYPNFKIMKNRYFPLDFRSNQTNFFNKKISWITVFLLKKILKNHPFFIPPIWKMIEKRNSFEIQLNKSWNTNIILYSLVHKQN